MYDVPLITITELTADEYEERVGIPFNSPDWLPGVWVTVNTGVTVTTTLMLLDGATLQHDFVDVP